MLQKEKCLLAAPSLRRVALSLATLLLLATAAAYSIRSWQSEVREQRAAQEALVEVGSKALDAYFLGLERALGALGQQLAVSGWEGRAAHLFSEFHRQNPDLQIALLMRADGQVLAAASGAPRPALPDQAQQPHFIEARRRLLEGETMIVGRPFRSEMAHNWVTPLSYGLRDAQGRLVYVIGLGLPLVKTLSFWRDAPIAANATLSLIRDDGYLVARHPVTEPASQQALYSQPIRGALTRHLSENHFPAAGTVIGDGSFSGIPGGSVLVFRRLAHYPLTFYYRNPRLNLLSHWWEDVWFTYALLGLMFAGSVAIYAWSTARQSRWDEERSQRIEDLEAANRELAGFTYTISHDLRAPLRAIDGYAALHLEDLAAERTNISTTHVERIRDNAMRMAKLIDGLLDFSRQSQVALNRGRVDIGALVRSVLAEHSATSSRAQVVIGDLPDRYGDPALLRKVWHNLVTNALKYTAHVETPRIEIGYEDGAYFVRDNGAGFDMEHAGKLFGMFSRLHHAGEFEGNGVGLAIVRRIIERHGGRIWASGETGKGAEFRFALAERATPR
jgi:signal transduction histidine kinase